MDTNAGEFVEEERAERWMQRLQVGEIVKIKGEELQVVSTDKREVTLRLLSAADRLKNLFGIETDLNRHKRRERDAMERKLMKLHKGNAP